MRKRNCRWKILCSNCSYRRRSLFITALPRNYCSNCSQSQWCLFFFIHGLKCYSKRIFKIIFVYRKFFFFFLVWQTYSISSLSTKKFEIITHRTLQSLLLFSHQPNLLDKTLKKKNQQLYHTSCSFNFKLFRCVVSHLA